jgi:tRNA A-37 threonylcarbamoyl transferase component Bud32
MSDAAGGQAHADVSIERSPADVLRVVVAVAALALFLLLDRLFGDSVITFTGQLLDGFDEIPGWIFSLLLGLTRLGVAVALVAGFVAVLRFRMWRALITTAVAAGVGLLFALIVDAFQFDPNLVRPDEDLLGRLGGPEFPSATGLAVAAAVLTAAAPWLPRSWRQAGWTLLVAMAVCHFITAPLSLQVVVSLLWGWTAGAGTLVALGAPARRPDQASIEAGLRAVGVEVSDLHPAAVDARGSTPYFGSTPEGSLFVKVLGKDERSADLLFRIWRSWRHKLLGDERPFSSLRRAVEHEALVALAARDLGVRTPRFVALATAEPDGFVLAYEGIDGKSLDGVPVDDLTDELLAEVWALLALIRHHRIAHRDLRLANVFRDADGHAWLIDFGFSELAASDLLLATDVAEALASQSLQVDAERVVAAATTAMGADAVASARDRLKPVALSGATRTALKERPEVLDRLHELTEAAAS